MRFRVYFEALHSGFRVLGLGMSACRDPLNIPESRDMAVSEDRGYLILGSLK